MFHRDSTEQPSVASSNKAWMVIFTDLVSLMLTFFVLLFSMSSLQIDRWEEMTNALSRTLNPSYEKTPVAVTAEYNIAKILRKRAVNLDYLGAVLAETMARNPMLSRGRVLQQENRLVIALPSDLLFAAGQADLSARAEEALFVLGGLLSNVGNQIGIDGHTDPVPPRSGFYPSNWELSLARAVSVANALKVAGYREDIRAYAYADSRYHLLPDLPEEERRALGRRVDLVILPTVGDG